MTITIKKLNEQQFLDIKDNWQSLLENSCANSLFFSWTWQYLWWKTWESKLKGKLLLLAMYDDETLVGLAPLFMCNLNFGPIKAFKRIQFIGNTWRLIDTVRTEYSSFIVASSRADELEKHFIAYIYQHIEWDEWIINDIDKSSSAYQYFKSMSFNKKTNYRVLNRDTGVIIDCQKPFKTYLALLSKNTRAKTYNARGKLLKFGNVVVETVSSKERVIFAFRQLNLLHKVRWGKKCFDGEALEFHLKLSLSSLKNNGLKLSMILLDGVVISVLYNVIVDGCEYNIQAGFNDKKFKGISLGSLHLGYAIEHAFNDSACNKFDLLAGFGMKSDYKKRFRGDTSLFRTIQFVRNPILKQLYALYELIPSKAKYWLYNLKGFG